MRRSLLGLLLILGLLALAGCGNKGPLVRPPAPHPAGTTPAASTAHPATGMPVHPAAGTPVQRTLPATAGSSGRGL